MISSGKLSFYVLLYHHYRGVGIVTQPTGGGELWLESVQGQKLAIHQSQRGTFPRLERVPKGVGSPVAELGVTMGHVRLDKSGCWTGLRTGLGLICWVGPKLTIHLTWKVI